MKRTITVEMSSEFGEASAVAYTDDSGLGHVTSQRLISKSEDAYVLAETVVRDVLNFLKRLETPHKACE